LEDDIDSRRSPIHRRIDMLIMLSRLFSLRNLEQVAKTEFVYAVSTV